MPQQLLTRRKAKWVSRVQPQMLRGTALRPNAGTEARYYQQLEILVKCCSKLARAELEKFYASEHAEEFFAQDMTVAAQARILTNAIAAKFNDIFSLHAKPLAEQMVGASDKNASASLHQSLQQLSGGLSLKTTGLSDDLTDILSASVTENVGLIKSIGAQYAQGIQGAVMRSITTGGGLETLVPFLKTHEGVTLRRARNIAEDQSRKAFSNIAKIKMQNVGIDEYTWKHSSASLVPRKLHQSYDGKIFSFSNPPIVDEKSGRRGKPGDEIECKCFMIPVITFAGE